MTHVALYRRFRPQNFDDLLGQDALVNTLKGQVMTERINHAYLFCGPRGIGKTTAARILAKAINCQNPQNGNFCGECSACLALNNQSNFDIVEIDAASNNGVDNIRDLRENIKFMPAAGKYRVYIIDEVHMLSISAFNALLKTLEEPPAHIVFIMATTEPNKLPITVLSRCQRFDFNRFKASDIIKLLKKVAKEAEIKIEDKAIESIARASEGGARDALSLLDQCSAFTEGEITAENVSTILGSANRLMYFALADSILTQDTARALRGFNKMLDDGCNTLSVARDLMSHFRDLFIAKHVKDVADTLAVDDVMASRLAAQAAKLSEGTLIRCIELFSTLESDLRYASHPRVFIELAIAKACRSEKDNSYESVLERIEKIENALSSGAFQQTAHSDVTDESTKKKAEIEITDTQETAAIQEDYPPFDGPPPEEEEFNTSSMEDDVYMQFGESSAEQAGEEYFPYKDEEPKQSVKKTKAKISEEKAEEKPEDSNVSLMNEINKLTKPKEEKPAKKKNSNAATGNAKELWKRTIDILKRQKKMGIVTAMRKGEPKSIDGEVLLIIYDPNLAGLERVEEASNLRMINEALTEAAGDTMHVKIQHKVLNEEEIGFLEDISKFPKDLINKN